MPRAQPRSQPSAWDDSPDGVAYDADRQYMYVANRGANSVTVIDTSTRAKIGSSVGVGAVPRGVAYDSEHWGCT